MTKSKQEKVTEHQLRNMMFVYLQDNRGLHRAANMATIFAAKEDAIASVLRKMEAEGVVVSYRADRERVYAFVRG